MKFVCDKCSTKYSIADEKVRRKVLKIRCKNCGNIIVVRESTSRVPPSSALRPSAEVSALDAAFDGAFGPADSALGDEREFDAEQTRFDAAPPVHQQDEWYMALDGHQYGPMAFSELCNRVKRGESRSETGEEAYVWHDGLDDWIEVSKLPELRPYVPPPFPRGGRSGLLSVDALDSSEAFMVPPAADRGRPPPTGGYPAVSVNEGLGSEMRAALGSGLAVLPPAYDSQQPLAGAQLSPAGPSKSPWSLRIAATAAIISALTGVAILVYFLWFDRPPKQPVHPVIAGVAPTTAVATDAGTGPMRFEPMQVKRSAGGEREVHAAIRSGQQPATSDPPAHATKAAPADPGSKLTAAQRRLLALYGKQSARNNDLPSMTTPTRHTGPKRHLTSRDIEHLQRTNRRALKACYERAVKRDTSLSNARVDVEVSIGDSGVVREVTLSGSNSPDLVGCLRRGIRRWVFPAVGSQTVSFPLIFRGS
ncbi:MAG: zinc-ribbon domain-containing protein [Deltaproteobacteria bacterium]|nr:zinc-ribbon domain-containing protein [Deltaproteobacteria bacterium]